MKRLVLLVLALTAVTVSAMAQNLSVKGTVRDAKTGEVLPMVNVGLMRVADTVLSLIHI